MGITFLDCTLRDGGYYNNWDFDIQQSQLLLKSLNRAGVDIIEVGYKSPAETGDFFGLYKYCNEEFLDFLSKDDSSAYAFMIDVKEFISTDNSIDYASLNKVIRPTSESVFTWVRLATHFATVESIPEFVTYFRKKGYKVGYNLMGGSLLSNDQIIRGAEIAKEADVEVFYMADSFGSFYPEDVRNLIRLIRDYYPGKLGIHTHDNQGMAYANTIAAIEEGVEFVDGTMTGMGRGAGNLLTEQFLLGYSEKYPDSRFSPSSLLQIINKYIEPLKQEFKWGFNYTYMYSGLKNIHPTYCQKLSESNRFTTEESSDILAAIPPGNRMKFNSQVLNNAINKQLDKEVHSNEARQINPFDTKFWNHESVVIVARGITTKQHLDGVLKFAQNRDIPIIECNPTGFFDANTNRWLVILNQLKLQSWIKSSNGSDASKVVTGIPSSSATNTDDIYFYPFHIGEFDPYGNELSIPDYDAGIYAIALAIRSGVKNIYLVGFDGFQDQEINLAKDALLIQIRKKLEGQEVNLTFLTPTKYSAFDKASLYSL